MTPITPDLLRCFVLYQSDKTSQTDPGKVVAVHADAIRKQIEAYGKSGVNLNEWTPENELILTKRAADLNNDIDKLSQTAVTVATAATGAEITSQKIDLTAFFKGYFAELEKKYSAQLNEPSPSNMNAAQRKQSFEQRKQQLADALNTYTLVYQQYKDAGIQSKIADNVFIQAEKYINDGEASDELTKAWLLFMVKESEVGKKVNLSLGRAKRLSSYILKYPKIVPEIGSIVLDALLSEILYNLKVIWAKRMWEPWEEAFNETWKTLEVISMMLSLSLSDRHLVKLLKS